MIDLEAARAINEDALASVEAASDHQIPVPVLLAVGMFSLLIDELHEMRADNAAVADTMNHAVRGGRRL